MKTVRFSPDSIQRNWVQVDASGQTLGRLASQIAYVLRGKHKPQYVPYWESGDFVVVTNAAKIHLTGNKLQGKIAYHHSGYVGGIKAETAAVTLEKHPERLLYNAVKGMLPKSKLARRMLKSLKIFPGVTHDHAAQKPTAMPERTIKAAQ